ncbi:hypothetical protein [Myroides odoratus]|uniref:hypothetical protein n=1 Tax=Myroides odoratus TaxID=256 RepID=UPI00333F9287
MTFISDLIINNTALRIKTGEKLNKLWSDIGDKSQLLTSNRTSLVNAINEVKSTSLSSNDSRISNWDTAFNRGDFRDYGLGTAGLSGIDSWDKTKILVTSLHKGGDHGITGISDNIYGTSYVGNSRYAFDLAGHWTGRAFIRGWSANATNGWHELWHTGNASSIVTKLSVLASPNYGLRFNYSDSTSSNETTRTYLGTTVIDTRSTQSVLGSDGTATYLPKTQDIPSTTTFSLFHYIDNKYYTSIISKGWNGSYASWKISGIAHTTSGSAMQDFYLSHTIGGGEWGPDYKIWHNGNLTNVSQLNNDSGYITASTAGFVKKTGDTMTGPLTSSASTGLIMKTDNYALLERDMVTINGAWARTLHRTKHNDISLDVIGHYGEGGILRYGYIGGTAYNQTNTIRWTTDGKVGIGLSGTILPSEALDVVGTIKTNLHGDSSQWKQAFDWGTHIGKYLNLGDNRIFRSKSVGADLDLQKDSVVYATGANRPNNTNSTVITLSGLADYGFQIASRNANIWFRGLEAGNYRDWYSFWHSGNLVNPATQDWVTSRGYVTTDTTYSVFTRTVPGLVPMPGGTTATRYLREDGTWVVPTNTTYSAGTLALLNAGTDTSNRVWSTKVLADYVVAKLAQGADSIWEHTPQGGLRIRNYDSLASRDGAIAITKGGGATKINAIGIGTSINSDGNDGIVVGPLSVNLGTYGTVVGPYSVNTAMEGVVTGTFLQNNQRGCTVTGRYNHPIQNTTTNTINNYSPLFIIGNGKSASIRSNAYEMFSDGKGEFANVQSYKNQHSFGDMDIPNWKFIQDNISGGDGNGSEDWVSNYGSQISVFLESKANEHLGDSPYEGTGEILADQKFSNVDKPTLVYLGNDGIWRKWNNSANAEQGNLSNSAVLGIALGDMKSVLLRGYYVAKLSVELQDLVIEVNNGNMFHSINKGTLMAGSSTSFTERVFGYSINSEVAYFNPWMFKR